VRQFYLDPEAPEGLPEPGDERVLDAEESRHLLRVLRARPGAAVRLTDGRGHVFAAELLGGDVRGARVRVTAVTRDEAELLAPRLVLACGLIKGKRWEALLETAVELGAHTVAPLAAARAEVAPGAGRRRRWLTVLQTALKQSGRAWCPDLAEPVAPAEFLANAAGEVYFGRARDRARDVADPALLAPADLASPPPGAAAPPALVWCVGPEGGWTDAESEALAARGDAVRLGAHRLRTATAAAAGLLLLAARREALLGPGPAGAGPRPADGA